MNRQSGVPRPGQLPLGQSRQPFLPYQPSQPDGLQSDISLRHILPGGLCTTNSNRACPACCAISSGGYTVVPLSNYTTPSMRTGVVMTAFEQNRLEVLKMTVKERQAAAAGPARAPVRNPGGSPNACSNGNSCPTLRDLVRESTPWYPTNSGYKPRRLGPRVGNRHSRRLSLRRNRCRDPDRDRHGHGTAFKIQGQRQRPQ